MRRAADDKLVVAKVKARQARAVHVANGRNLQHCSTGQQRIRLRHTGGQCIGGAVDLHIKLPPKICAARDRHVDLARQLQANQLGKPRKVICAQIGVEGGFEPVRHARQADRADQAKAFPLEIDLIKSKRAATAVIDAHVAAETVPDRALQAWIGKGQPTRVKTHAGLDVFGLG